LAMGYSVYSCYAAVGGARYKAIINAAVADVRAARVISTKSFESAERKYGDCR
jgi:hypothetical protein